MLRIKTLLNNTYFVFGLFWVLILLVCLPAYKAGFVAEYISYLQEYEQASFVDFVNRKSAYVKSFYQVSTFFRYCYVGLFGKQQIPCYFLFTGLHALVALGTYTFFRRLFADFSVARPQTIAFLGALLFLLNPNISEVTIWKGCDHYYVSILCQLLSLNLALKYLRHPGRYWQSWNIGVFIVSIFCLEIFYITPFLLSFLFWGYYEKKIIEKALLLEVMRRIVLPMLLLFCIYLIAFRLVFGTWFAHYGTTDEFVWSLADMLKAYGRYVAYLGIMLSHWPQAWREPVYHFLSHPLVYTTIPVLLIFTPLVLVFRFRRLRSLQQVLLFVWAAFVCSLTLCVTTFFDELFAMYNSRRCYHPGIFFYMGFVLLLFHVSRYRLALCLYAFYLLPAVLLSVRISFRWARAAGVQYALLDHFQWTNADNVILLNLPTYYKDVRIMPDLQYNEFADQLRFFTGRQLSGHLYSVMGYNMNALQDGAHVCVLDSRTLKVTLNQWGGWWMYQCIGAADYENDLYRVEIKDIGHEYLISFKKPLSGKDIVLFQKGGNWQSVNWSVTGEQW